jgi:tetratricopeptide (TPR) repeat protein
MKMAKMTWKEINERYVKRALTAWRSGNVEEARTLFKEGFASTNDGFVALKYGEFLESTGQLAEALGMFEDAHALLPKPEYKQQARDGAERVRRLLQQGSANVSPSPPSQEGRVVGLISCTKSKKRYPCTARELYSESPNFVAHLGYAEKHYEKTYVVSARHGLVELTQILNWYDRSLDQLQDDERVAWAKFVAACLRLENISADDTVAVHANRLYQKHLSDALAQCGVTVRLLDFDAPPPV